MNAIVSRKWHITMIMNQTNIMKTAYWTVWNMSMSYDMTCLDMMDGGNGYWLSLSLTVVNSCRNLNTVAKIGSWSNSVNDWIISSVNLSVYQLTGTWRFCPFANFILSCVFWLGSLVELGNKLVRQIKLRIQALINILIFTDRCSF